jgi:hypothetical protein
VDLPQSDTDCQGTTVYFPLTPSLALLGKFDGRTDDLSADVFAVGDLNRRILNNAGRQIYAANKKFQVFDHVTLVGIDEVVRRMRKHEQESAD